MKLRLLLSGMGICALAACGRSSHVFVPAAGHRLFTANKGNTLEATNEVLLLTENSEAEALRAGDLVARQDRAGYLGRVSEVIQARNGLQVRLEPVSIADAFESVDAEDEVEFEPELESTRLPPFSFSFQTRIGEHDYYYTLTSRDGKLTRECDDDGCNTFVWEFPNITLEVFQLETNQSIFRLSADKLVIKKNVSVDFLLAQKFHQVESFRLIKNEKNEQHFENVTISIAKRFPVASFDFPIFNNPVLATVPIGPMVMTLGMKMKLGVYSLVESAVQAKLKASFSETSRSEFGAWYERANGWHIVDKKSLQPKFHFQKMEWHALPAAFIGGAFVDAAVNVNLFGVAGPELFMRAYPAEASIGTRDEHLKGTVSARLKGGARFMVKGVKMPLFEFAAVDAKKTYCNFDFKLADLLTWNLSRGNAPFCTFHS